jgi:hypothetical protein|tara:strand:+ start:1103 stop:1576 length:474 start_codon:yes stop_codon:yes gene_type:complete
MTIEKKIAYKEGVEKIKFIADLKARFEKAKEGGFKGNIREFILKEKYKDILGEAGYAKGGPTNRPNGLTTISLDDWLESIDPGGWASEEDKPVKVSFKYGATSQSEEDLIGGHVDDWTNAINKGDLDPSVDFMQYINMILGRDSVSRGGIVSIVPTL